MEIRLNVSPRELAIRKGLGKGGRVQKFVDSECIKLMAPYTPRQTGLLEGAAARGTVLGEGRIVQSTPYARYLYYGEVYGPNIPIQENGQVVGFRSPPQKSPTGRALQYSTEKNPLAGKMWFERMKADHKEDILRGAMQIAEGGR